MIETQTILVKVNGMNYKYYHGKGYSVLTNDGKMDRNKEIWISVYDAKYSYGCGPTVKANCDKCGLKFEVLIGTINNQIKKKGTCFCKKCNDSISAKKRVKEINPGGRKELMLVETNFLCFGGCGKKATHQSKVGNLWCNYLGGIKCSASQNRAVKTFKNKGCNQGERNGMFGKHHSDSHKEKISNTMKQKITNGEFTPVVTNSWANSKTFLQIDNCVYNFRSSWEAIFWLMNKKCEYEKLRIGYQDENNIFRNYIVDFIDTNNRKLYEIKPKSEKNNKRNILKKEAAEKWSKDNNYEYIIITEDWFKEYLTNENVKYISDFGEKIQQGLKGLLK